MKQAKVHTYYARHMDSGDIYAIEETTTGIRGTCGPIQPSEMGDPSHHVFNVENGDWANRQNWSWLMAESFASTNGKPVYDH